MTVLKYFLEALCGQEEPLLAFKGGKYISMATPPTPSVNTENKVQTQEQVQRISHYWAVFSFSSNLRPLFFQ